ncbi:hypothetical protein [Pseudonocardia sp.]|uniref:hypothetical protein n=1 Tax=Pseudonocardia sp. TaxID=60912 RepID=UPI0026359C16|nr:hypothetical protein [Pseudonocardia sp.]
MTAPDYPLLALGSYETYQLAHIATYIAERIGRHHRCGRGRDGRAARAQAVRDIAGAATALGNATGAAIPERDLPRPLDARTFSAARQLLDTGPRAADVVALSGLDQAGFAVIGNVPGLGAVGALTASKDIADALRAHLLTRPAGELAPWVVTRDPRNVPTLPRSVDLARFAEHLDPRRDDDRAVARNLRGHDPRTDAAVRGRFAAVDLDAPPIVAPPPRPAAAGPRRPTAHRPDGPAPGVAEQPSRGMGGDGRPAAPSR